MNITEKDIYLYVMDKESLSDDKFKYIQQNIDKFIEEIAFLNEIKEDLSSEISPDLLEKIQNKIDDVDNKTIVLRPINTDVENKFSRLAADSFTISDSANSYTLYDDKKEFLIKINSTTEKCKIYLFTLKELERRIIPIKFNPTGDSYYLNLDEQPLTVDSVPEIDSIELLYS